MTAIRKKRRSIMHARALPAAAGVVGIALSLAAAGIMRAAPAAPATTFEIAGAKTEAAIAATAAGTPVIQLKFAAALAFDGAPDLSDDVFVGWQEVGGVDPQPFRILIPAGCFVDRGDRGFQLRDFQACGVQIVADAGGRLGTELSIVDFKGRVALRDDGRYRFDIAAVFGPPPPDAGVPPDPIHPFLRLLAGTAVEIAIASESSMALPLRTETVSGVDPTPF
jgi:hypothetical protein